MPRDGWKLVPIGEFGRWSKEWTRLNREATHDHPVLHPHFGEPASEQLAPGDEVLALLFRGGEPAGAAIVKRGRRLTWEVWCPSQLVVAPAVLPGDLEQRELDGLFQQLGGSAGRLVFWRQDPMFWGFDSKALDDRRHRIRSYWETVSVLVEGDFDRYWRDRPAKLRREVGACLRYLHCREFSRTSASVCA